MSYYDIFLRGKCSLLKGKRRDGVYDASRQK